MFKSAKAAITGVTKAKEAWGTLRSAKSFGGLTPEQFNDGTKAMYEVRAEIAELQHRLQALITRRSVVDAAGVELLRRVILGVKGDPEEGEDSEFYEALGYVRRSDRGTGLTRRRAKNEPNSPQKENDTAH